MEDRTLVIGPSWVGDMVMSQSLLKTIKNQHPETKIDVLAPAWSQSLTQRMPEVSGGIHMPTGHGELGLSKRYQIAKSLRNRYRRSYVLPNSFKSALVPFWAKIPLRIGWRGEWRYPLLNDIRVLDKKRFPLMVQRYVALGYEATRPAPLPENVPVPQLIVDEINVQAALEKYQLSLEKGPVIALCPGAEFGPSKRWPDEYYAQLAQYFLNLNYQVWIFGSQKDDAVAQRINRVCEDRCENLCGRTSLAEAIDLLSLSQCVVSNDSGLMHIAASLNRPVVAIYGSTDPGFTPP